MNNLKLFLFIFLSLIILVSFSNALLVSPAKLQLDYSEDYVEFETIVYNDINEEIEVSITFESVEGRKDYSEYFEITNLDSETFSIPANGNQLIHFKMKYPEFEKFGLQRFVYLRFYQVPAEKEYQIGATVAILIPIESNIPYPDKFVSVTMTDFGSVKKGEVKILNATLENIGVLDINSIVGDFIIKNNENSVELPFVPLGLNVDDSKTIFANLDTNNLDSGLYEVYLNLEYDGESRTSDSVPLIVGEKNVEILDFNPKELKTKSINSVYFSVISLWDDDINPTFNINLIQGDSIIKTYDIGIYTLQKSEKKDIYFAMDLAGISAGDYIMRVNSQIDGNTASEDFVVSLYDESIDYSPEIGGLSFVTIYILLIVIIILLLVIVGYLIFRKKNENNS